ncbi:TetR/AcrR family transcriptional regulator [Streptomyces synnematoformans]|uniref:TetR/AcrR family transcriptional regulator C-terminal domain-containing protein n=1 Tax=Streptomyces synnematoformans TaxID=415721 RepID=A0ABP5IVC2_9ACTN
MGNPTPLSRESIVDAAMDIARAEGLAGVTMRALAARLDVTPMALYRYIGDRGELTRLVADRVGALVRPAAAPHDANWEESVRAWATAQRSVLRRYPGLAAWLMDNGPAGPQAYRLLELLAAALAGAGFDDARVARGSALIMSWTFSRIAIEDNADARRNARRPNRAQAFVTGLDTIDVSVYPTAARVGAEFFTLSMEEIFATGLDSIIAGLTTHGT